MREIARERGIVCERERGKRERKEREERERGRDRAWLMLPPWEVRTGTYVCMCL